MQFSQPVYCLKLLHNIYKANKAVLEKHYLQKDWSRLSSLLRENATLADLVLSAKESEYAWPTLNALWSELTQPGRPPVLLGLDGLAHINKISEYRDPSYKRVHSHDLSLVRLFTDALSGKTELPNGGAIIAATSDNNTHYHPSQELVLSQLEAGQAARQVLQLEAGQTAAEAPQLEAGQTAAEVPQLEAGQTAPEVPHLQAGQTAPEAPHLEAGQTAPKVPQIELTQAAPQIPQPDPYERNYDNRVYDALKNSYVLRIGCLSKDEGRVLMEYWGASGMLRTVLDSRTVAEKWALGGHGIVGEMERVSLMTMRM